MAYFPLFIDCHRMQALVVGGGMIAGAKIESLLAHGATVTVVASKVGARVRSRIAACGMAVFERPYETADLAGKTLVVVAVNSAAESRRIAADVRRHGVLVNVVDNPPLCDFIFPAMIRRGPLQIAVSSGGVSPVLARLVKQTIELALPRRLDALIAFADEKRQIVRTRLKALQPRRLFWECVFRGPVAEAVMVGNTEQANIRFDHLLATTTDAPQAALYLIEVGGGDTGPISREAVRLLSQADTVFHDARISPALLEQFARRDAEKIVTGAPAGNGTCTPAGMLRQLAECWHRHAIVAVLQHGEMDAEPAASALARRLGVPIERAAANRAASATSAPTAHAWVLEHVTVGNPDDVE